MSGENESKKPTIEEKHNRIEALLRRYPAKVGLGVLQPSNEVERFLTMQTTEIRRLNAEECGEAAVVLNQAATYIQLELNRMQADAAWCNQYIDWLIAQNITQYGTQYTPFEYRKVLAIKDHDIAMQLQQIVTQIQLRVQSMSYIPNQLRATAASFSDLQQTKRSQRT